MRNLRILALLAALVSTGCLKVTHVVSVKPDGTGTIASTMAMSKAPMQGPAAALAAQGGSMMPTAATLRAAASSLGQGVRFVSSAPYKAGVFEGITANYAFDDVNKLKLNMEQALARAIKLPGQDGPPDPDAAVKLSLSRAGASSVLVVGMPKIPEPGSEQSEQARQAAAQAQSNPQLDAMMKQLLDGMLMEVVVDINGTIVKTNAPYVEGKRVVLLRLNGNQLLKSGTSAAQLMKMGQGGDIRKVLSQVPGLKVVMIPEVRVEFK